MVKNRNLSQTKVQKNTTKNKLKYQKKCTLLVELLDDRRIDVILHQHDREFQRKRENLDNVKKKENPKRVNTIPLGKHLQRKVADNLDQKKQVQMVSHHFADSVQSGKALVCALVEEVDQLVRLP